MKYSTLRDVSFGNLKNSTFFWKKKKKNSAITENWLDECYMGSGPGETTMRKCLSKLCLWFYVGEYLQLKRAYKNWQLNKVGFSCK